MSNPPNYHAVPPPQQTQPSQPPPTAPNSVTSSTANAKGPQTQVSANQWAGYYGNPYQYHQNAYQGWQQGHYMYPQHYGYQQQAYNAYGAYAYGMQGQGYAWPNHQQQYGQHHAYGQPNQNPIPTPPTPSTYPKPPPPPLPPTNSQQTASSLKKPDMDPLLAATNTPAATSGYLKGDGGGKGGGKKRSRFGPKTGGGSAGNGGGIRFGGNGGGSKDTQEPHIKGITMHNFPKSLENYVARVFNTCPKTLKQRMQLVLKAKIQIAQNMGTINTIDWDKEPVDILGISPGKMTMQFGKKRKKSTSFSEVFKRNDERSPSNSAKKKKKKKKSELELVMNEFDSKKRDNRKNRFKEYYVGKRQNKSKKRNSHYSVTPKYVSTGDLELDWEALKIVGTCEELEKPYLRLTSAPKPEKVRPERVLKNTYQMLVSKWEDKGGYKYTNEQFKSMRQDLMVQNIRNVFAVKVYETHARIAIETGDLSEFNQCQTQLGELYDLKHDLRTNFHEFMAYRVLYYTATDSTEGLANLLAFLNPSDRRSDPVKFAMAAYSAYTHGNFFQYYRLLERAPFHTRYILDALVPGVRLRALRTIVKGYRPTQVSIAFVAKALNLDVQECVKYVTACGAVLSPDKMKLMTKESLNIQAPVKEEPKDADDKRKGVTHGFFD
ncbi:hypothetical protein AAMO2058_000804700 [Amorphochlora amoebiformis]